MPFLTRDYIVFLGMVAFLLVAITTTGTRLLWMSEQSASVADVVLRDGPDILPKGETAAAAVVDRVERLQVVREKIATVVFTESVTDEPQFLSLDTPLASTEFVAGAISVCSSYSKSAVSWNAAAVDFAVVEGARLVYVESQGATTSNKEILLQLPVVSRPASRSTCLSTDVVGIALDGSLIRNDEYSLYGIFNDTTLIGYALDGFPVYGLSEQDTDACGGAVVDGEYRYFLSNNRDGVLGCFSGSPERL